MTKEQVIAWARECGADVDEAANPAVYASFADMQRFAKLVRNAALEEAAVKCVNYPEWAHWGQTDNYVIANKGAQDCAAAIESLKEPTS